MIEAMAREDEDQLSALRKNVPRKSKSGRWIVDRTKSGKRRHDRYNPDVQKIIKVYLPSKICFKIDIAHSSYSALKLASEKALAMERNKHETEDGTASNELTVGVLHPV